MYIYFILLRIVEMTFIRLERQKEVLKSSGPYLVLILGKLFYFELVAQSVVFNVNKMMAGIFRILLCAM